MWRPTSEAAQVIAGTTELLALQGSCLSPRRLTPLRLHHHRVASSSRMPLLVLLESNTEDSRVDDHDVTKLAILKVQWLNDNSCSLRL